MRRVTRPAARRLPGPGPRPGDGRLPGGRQAAARYGGAAPVSGKFVASLLGENRGGATPTSRHIASADLLGRGPGERLSPALRAHLESCASCRRLRDEVEGLLADMRSDRDPEPGE